MRNTVLQKKSKTYRTIKLFIHHLKHYFKKTEKVNYQTHIENALKANPKLNEIPYIKLLIRRSTFKTILYSFLDVTHLIPTKLSLNYSSNLFWLYERLRILENNSLYDTSLKLENMNLRERNFNLEKELNKLKKQINTSKIDWHGELKPLVEFFQFSRCSSNYQEAPIRDAQPKNIIEAILLVFEHKINGKTTPINRDTIRQYLKN